MDKLTEQILHTIHFNNKVIFEKDLNGIKVTIENEDGTSVSNILPTDDHVEKIPELIRFLENRLKIKKITNE